MVAIWQVILTFVVSISWRTWLHVALLLLIFVGGCTLGCQCASGAEPQSCPVNGSQCQCGCRSGQQCNCAKLGAAKEYYWLLTKLKPGDTFVVFVRMAKERRYLPAVRWDDYPGVTVPCEIVGYIGKDGNPYEEYRRYPRAPVVQTLPTVWSLVGCRS